LSLVALSPWNRGKAGTDSGMVKEESAWWQGKFQHVPLLPRVCLPTCITWWCSCIPVRYCQGKLGADAVEIMLVSRRGGKGWVLPKVLNECLDGAWWCLVSPGSGGARQGGWEDDEPVEAAAERETVEEAGVRGLLEVRNTRLRLQRWIAHND
jgi:hypothetical protein